MMMMMCSSHHSYSNKSARAYMRCVPRQNAERIIVGCTAMCYASLRGWQCRQTAKTRISFYGMGCISTRSDQTPVMRIFLA